MPQRRVTRCRPWTRSVEGETCRPIVSASGGPKGGASPSARSSPPGARPPSSARPPWPARVRFRHSPRPPAPALGLRPSDPGTPRVSRPALQRRLAPRQELVAPAAQLGGGDAELARDQLQLLAPQQAEHRLPLAPGRHPPPRLGRGPVSASVAGALRRAHAHPNVLVHPPPPCSLLPAKRCLSGT